MVKIRPVKIAGLATYVPPHVLTNADLERMVETSNEWILQRTGMHMSVGIAERDAVTGLAYNTAVLMGPNGIIGKYRKNGLNPQDQKVFAPGTTGVEVFDTPLGRIGLVICYDDTYWQYARLAALRGAQIIGWHSVSDRVMPGTPPAEATGNHSTVASVQYMSAQNGVWVVGATRITGWPSSQKPGPRLKVRRLLRRSSSVTVLRSRSTLTISPTKSWVTSSTTRPRSATISVERPRLGARQSAASTSLP